MVGRKNPYRELERRLGYRFKKRALLEVAFTHRSYRSEHPEVTEDNERLEFLGDAVLGFLTAAALCREHAERDEGFLTALRSQLTSGKALAECARELALGEHLRVGVGEEQSGGRRRMSNLANVMEAILGAAYVDGGIRACESVFKSVFAGRLHAHGGDVWAHNPKGRLQECCQRTWKAAPVYTVLRREGPPHATVFTVDVRTEDGLRGLGIGPSKQEAERRAAADLLRQIGEVQSDERHSASAAPAEAYLESGKRVRAGSCRDLAGDLVGCGEAPGDLSSNKKHLSGFGR